MFAKRFNDGATSKKHYLVFVKLDEEGLNRDMDYVSLVGRDQGGVGV